MRRRKPPGSRYEQPCSANPGSAAARPSTYCGPSGFKEYGGLPVVVGSSKLSRDENVQRQLWELSEQTTGVSYP